MTRFVRPFTSKNSTKEHRTLGPMTQEDDTTPSADGLGDLFEQYHWFAETFISEVAELRSVQDGLVDAVWPFTNALIASIDLTDATAAARSRIANQAVNDFLDLLYE